MKSKKAWKEEIALKENEILRKKRLERKRNP